MVSFEDQRYLETHRIPQLSDFMLYHLCSEMPSNPFHFLMNLLEPLVDSNGLIMPSVPSPQRPLPAAKRDYFGQLRIDVLIEEWLYELLTERPVETVRYTYHFFRRGAASRYAPEESSLLDGEELDNRRLGSPEDKYARNQSPLQPGDARLSRLSPSISPSIPPPLPPSNATPSRSDNESHDGYMGDVSPRPESSVNDSSAVHLEVPSQSRSPNQRSLNASRQGSASPGARSPHIRNTAVMSSVSVSPASSPEGSPLGHPVIPTQVRILVLVCSHQHCREIAYAAVEGLQQETTHVVESHVYRFPLHTMEAHEGESSFDLEQFEEDDPRYIPFMPSVHHELPQYDGVIFVLHAQLIRHQAHVQTLIDAAGRLCTASGGSLSGKIAGTMVAHFGGQGGSEGSHQTFQTALVHDGCVIVGVDPDDAKSSDGGCVRDVDGCCYYGDGTSQSPSDYEFSVARKHALRIAKCAARLQHQ